MTVRRPTALIADDEPLLRDKLTRLLADAWPELDVVALARNGREAVEHFEARQSDVCFLDVHMPGMSGVEAAHHIGRRAHLVFVTVRPYAVSIRSGALASGEAVERHACDTVARLQERLRTRSLANQRACAALSPSCPRRVHVRYVIRETVGQSLR